MNESGFISVFTPSRTSLADLEFIFVQREALLADAVERIQESASTNNKHHLLFIGPRGCGKTHLITLLVHRLSQQAALDDCLHIAWLHEDETSTCFLEFLIRIYRALCKRYPLSYTEDNLEPFYELSPQKAETALSAFLLKQIAGKTLLVLVENLDALFESLGETELRKLRAYIQEHPYFCLVATAQKLVEDISRRENTFYGFFQIEHLQNLSVNDATLLLFKIAELQQQYDLAAFLHTPTGKARVLALHHLAGGNHRIYIVLSQFISKDNIDALLIPFSKMIDEMTPYYQERIRWLPPQQRKIIELLCDSSRPISVKNLAKRLFASPQSISSQLANLRDKGYVQSMSRGRESLYEISEPLMRLCVEIKENQSSKPIMLLVDFLRVWYDADNLQKHLQNCGGTIQANHYLQTALDHNRLFGNLRSRLLIDDCHQLFNDIQLAQWLPEIEDLAGQSEELALAYKEWRQGDAEQALQSLCEITRDTERFSKKTILSAFRLALKVAEDYKKTELLISIFSNVLAISNLSDDEVIVALVNRGLMYARQDNFDAAVLDLSTTLNTTKISINVKALILLSRGLSYQHLEEFDLAQADYSAVIALGVSGNARIQDAHLLRGRLYGLKEDYKNAVTDFDTAFSFANNIIDNNRPVLLVLRGISHFACSNFDAAWLDFTTMINSLEVDQRFKVNPYFFLKAICKQIEHYQSEYEKILTTTANSSTSPLTKTLQACLAIEKDDWQQGLSILDAALQTGFTAENYEPTIDVFGDIINWLYLGKASAATTKQRVFELCTLFNHYEANSLLSDALIKHLGVIHQNLTMSGNADYLEQWANAWEAVGQVLEAYSLTLRIFRTGIDFLKTGAVDQGILLNLHQEERIILRQVLNMEPE
jgi:tetratricopeptide (TPR) repeat protein/DNA-binding transcriptional ArsR family regulator